MIEKLKYGDSVSTRTDKVNDMMDVVSRLVDMVNIHEKEIDELQMKANPEKLKTYLDKAKDWVGFLCRFRDRDDEKWHYGILKSVDDDTDFPFWDENDFEWAACQLVKPTDMAIKENNIEF